MSAEYVRRHYGVDYKRGDRVTVNGEPGTIVSFPDQYLGVRFDDAPRHTARAHPTWRVERIAQQCKGCGVVVSEKRQQEESWRESHLCLICLWGPLL